MDLLPSEIRKAVVRRLNFKDYCKTIFIKCLYDSTREHVRDLKYYQNCTSVDSIKGITYANRPGEGFISRIATFNIQFEPFNGTNWIDALSIYPITSRGIQRGTQLYLPVHEIPKDGMISTTPLPEELRPAKEEDFVSDYYIINIGTNGIIRVYGRE